LSVLECCDTSLVFAGQAADLSPSNAAAYAVRYRVSTGYFQAAGSALLAGREFTSHDDKSAAPVAVVNQLFAKRIFGSLTQALGAYFKMPDGARIQVVGVVEDGRYDGPMEEPKCAMFFPVQPLASCF